MAVTSIFVFCSVVWGDTVIIHNNAKPYTVPIEANDIEQITFKKGFTSKHKPLTDRQAPLKAGRLFRVGASAAYKAPSEIAGVAANSNIIEIDAGDYPNDVAVWRQNDIVLRGVGGKAHLKANGNAAERKAIWVIKGNNVIIENIEFSGARVATKNGAGIRFEGTNLTIRNCYFHDNEMGFLTGTNLDSEIIIENSEFNNNSVDYRRYGKLGHNIYVGKVKRFILKGSYIHDANIGHNVKSRARENFILYNRIMDQQNGSSYLIDLALGGDAYIIGNTFHQSRLNDNNTMISYAAEGNRELENNNLYIINNTLVSTANSSQFIWNHSASSASIINNLFVGPGEPFTGKGDFRNNLHLNSAQVKDFKGLDFRLVPQSKAIDQGVHLDQTKQGINLTPRFQYAHPSSMEARPISGKIDIGAYEYSNR